MLHIEALHAGYGDGTVLHDLHLDAAAGQVHAVAGVNGAGKTTLLHTIAGLLRPTSGRILLDGRDITDLPTHRRARAGTALVPQGRRVFATLTVAEHLAISTRHRKALASRTWHRQAVLDLFPQLAARLHHRGGQLSGGEQQMLAIARALLTQPRLLLADEPTEGLAPTLASQIRDLLPLIATTGPAILLATPTSDLAEAADQVTLLIGGHSASATNSAGHIDGRQLRTALTPGAATPTTPTALPGSTNREPAWAGLLHPSPSTHRPQPRQETTVTETIPTYFFDNSAAQGQQQLDALAGYLDPITTACLRDIVPIHSGMRCLELGPGGGSIASWLTRRIGPHGTVITVDKDPSRVTPAPNLTIVQHDLHDGLPGEAAGPFQLIHARLVLVHLVNRVQLLTELVERLAPNGWLVIGEFVTHPMRVQAAASGEDTALYLRVLDAFTNVLVTRHGADIEWGHRVHQAMHTAGLRNVDTIEHIESWTGSQPGNQLHVANINGMRPRLLDAGLTNAELDAFLGLLDDPGFAAPSWPFTLTRGRKPAADDA
jgi:branched-chain amino acid transport system ATP-binding protein